MAPDSPLGTAAQARRGLLILVNRTAGDDMELHPRPVDVPVTRPVGESYTGKDSQLDVAVKELLAQLGTR